MKVSIAVTNVSWPVPTAELADRLVSTARQAEQVGVDTLWVADHLIQVEPGTSPDEPMLEAYATLAFLAAVTRRLRLGTMVTWASLRPAALLIKTVTTLDVLSGGRAWLGLGVGYRGDEAARLGLPFAGTAERFEQLEELLQLTDRMWAGSREPFRGKHLRLDEPILRPLPVRRPRILIGGTGEQRTLPLVARYADACNLFDIPDGGETVRHKLDVLRRACAAIGRDPAEIEVTLSSRLGPGESAAAFAERCERWDAQGVGHLVLVGNGPWTEDALAVVGAALERLGLDVGQTVRTDQAPMPATGRPSSR